MNELEELGCPQGRCLVGEEEGGLGWSWRGRQGIDHAEPCAPHKGFWSLAQESHWRIWSRKMTQSIYIFQNINNFNYHMNNRMWWAPKEKEKSRATLISKVNTVLVPLCEDVHSLNTCSCKYKLLLTLSQCIFKIPNTVSQNLSAFFPKSFPSE